MRTTRVAGALGDAVEHRTELVVAVADEEPRPLPEGRRVAQLLRSPLPGGRARHRHVDDAPGVHVDDEEREDRTEPDVVGLQEVAGPDGVVSQEGRASSGPRCGEGGRAPRMYRWTVRFATRMPSFKSSPRIRSAPQRRFSIAMRWMRAMTSRSHARLARTGRAGLVTPEQPESRAVPAKNGLGLDEEQGAAPPGKKPREQDKQTTLVAAKGGAFDAARGDDELLAQKRVLGDQLGARTGQIGDEATRDARGPACVAKRPHHSFRKLDSRCGKLAEDAEHRAIGAKPRAIIKGLFCRQSRAIVWWRREVATTASDPGPADDPPTPALVKNTAL